jgi:pimeloyl-ACP methyl ester carboxylesterase
VTTIGAIDRLEIEAGGLTFTGRACGPHGGRPVLLLHGFPQTSWAWRDELWALAAEGYRAVAPDQRGYCSGARPTEPEAYATGRLAGDVLALADSLEMDTFDLVGHDWGGMLAWLVASQRPDRVRSLTVVSTPHPLALGRANGRGDEDGATAFLCSPEEPERLLLGADGSGGGLASVLADSGLDDDDANMYVTALSEPGALTAALNWFRAMDATSLVDLRPVSVPTLYVWSTGDGVFGRDVAEATSAHVCGPYAFEVLEEVSHWIPEMAPGRLSSLLVRHLAAT